MNQHNSWTIVKLFHFLPERKADSSVYVSVCISLFVCDSPTQCNSLEKIETNISRFVTNAVVICTKCLISSYKNIVLVISFVSYRR